MPCLMISFTSSKRIAFVVLVLCLCEMYTSLKIFYIMEQCVFFLHPQNNKLQRSDITLICDTFVVTLCKSIKKNSIAKKMWHFV